MLDAPRLGFIPVAVSVHASLHHPLTLAFSTAIVIKTASAHPARSEASHVDLLEREELALAQPDVEGRREQIDPLPQRCGETAIPHGRLPTRTLAVTRPACISTMETS